MAWRVFVVEDLRSMQLLLADLFSTIGSIEIVDASTTEAEAKLWLEENPGAWDLAIVDLMLAQGSGMGVVPQARRTARPGAKIVVFSGYASAGIRAHCLALGADAVFEKSETGQFISWLTREAGDAAF